MIVVGGNDGGGGNHIVFSTDDGGTWTDASTQPSAAIYCVDMFDANTGYAVDSSGNIWKTTNAAVDWTDTTHNITETATVGMSIRALSATTAIISAGSGIEYYDNGAGTSTRRMKTDQNTTLGIAVVGSSYFVATGANDASEAVTLWRSDNSGTNWEGRLIDVKQFNQNDTEKTGISEFSTTHILLTTNSGFAFKIPGK